MCCTPVPGSTRCGSSSTSRSSRRASRRAPGRSPGPPESRGPFAGKVLSALAAAGLVRSRRGPHGGVMLARRASSISLLDVASALGEDAAISECILGFHACSDVTPCPIHPAWKRMREDLRESLLDRNLAEFAQIPIQALPPGRAGPGRARGRRAELSRRREGVS